MRAALQETLATGMTATVEGLTGRKVVAFLSASHQSPDLTVETFVLEAEEADCPVTARGD